MAAIKKNLFHSETMEDTLNYLLSLTLRGWRYDSSLTATKGKVCLVTPALPPWYHLLGKLVPGRVPLSN
jgi:hypothetical protein